MTKLKRAIERNRNRVGLSIRALADKSGVSTFTICRMAKEDETTIGNIRKIAKAMGKRDWELLRDGDE